MRKTPKLIALTLAISALMVSAGAINQNATVFASNISSAPQVTEQIPQAQPNDIVYNNVSLAANGIWVKVTKWPTLDSTLSGIAKHYLGNANKWNTVYKANVSRVRNPNILRIGQSLWVPKGKPTTVTKPSNPKPNSSNIKWSSPLPGASITSCFGWRHLKGRSAAMHEGLDMSRPSGAKIYAPANGTVVETGWWAGGYGISVLIFGGNKTYYHLAHMEKSLVFVGKHVKAGDVIGLVGSTGDATGPHLHFEVWSGMWHQINPAPWLRKHGLSAGSC